MTHYRAEWPAAGAFGMRRARLLPVALSSLLILLLLVITAGGVGASSQRSTTDASDGPAAETTLAIVRSGGASLIDDDGKLLVELSGGATLTVRGRTSDNRWYYGSTATGAAGWVNASAVVIFGASNLPVREAPKAPPAAVSPTAQPAATSATSASRKPARSAAPATGLTGKLVFQERSGGEIYVYELVSGTLRLLTSGADPSISPDGRTVVFWRDTGEQALYLIGIDGGDERRILARGELVRAPTWSPDGRKIAFSHVIGQDVCRYVGYNFCYPDVFPYSYLFPVLVTMDRWGLARVDREGGDFQDLAALPSARSPSWTGRGIFYSSEGVYDGSEAIRGGAGIQITQDAPGDDANGVVLSNFRYQILRGQPGGDRIVFHSLEKDHWEIFVANGDGSGAVALTHPDARSPATLPHNVSPAWSPDGRRIVFVSNRSGRWELWVMNADGGDQRALPVDVSIEYNYQAEQVVSWGR